MTPHPGRRRSAALSLCAVLALLATACTGTNSVPGLDRSANGERVTITFWHGWTQDNETRAIDDNIAAFERLHPNIRVKAVGGITDDKINQALRAGVGGTPDVVSSFTTNSIGTFCAAHAFADLGPLLAKDGIDAAATFPATMLAYTRYQGDQCALPLLGDAYGLYYNRTAFAAAGITDPPRTLSEFDADAVRLTIPRGDGFRQLGFLPVYHGYETAPEHYLGQYGPGYFGADGRSDIATDPKAAAMFRWQKGLVDKLGGFDKLEKFRTSLGDEFSAANPFGTGQVAMALDGEWRTASLAEDEPDFEWATAPFPVPDDQADTYGRGYLTGTVIGIGAHTDKRTAAWELVKFLTTDTDAVVGFANAIRNVPSTFAALDSPELDADPKFRTFVDIARNPYSGTTPANIDGGAYLASIQNLGYAYESGRRTDLAAGLRATAKEIDATVKQAR
ncbi:extracellular solute-binding protein [Kitasatospora sp. NPDC057223]|uniref:extracellular solute-binding protein n=1 Tax=Kitasatospora sp. NPDC057223 TaxID=3346055 RepID=UPI003635AFCC